MYTNAYAQQHLSGTQTTNLSRDHRNAEEKNCVGLIMCVSSSAISFIAGCCQKSDMLRLTGGRHFEHFPPVRWYCSNSFIRYICNLSYHLPDDTVDGVLHVALLDDGAGNVVPVWAQLIISWILIKMRLCNTKSQYLQPLRGWGWGISRTSVALVGSLAKMFTKHTNTNIRII